MADAIKRNQLPDPTPADIEALTAKIWPIVAPFLRGQHPVAQGGALAEIVATWLAGHITAGDLAATRAMRNELLAEFIMTVEHLVPICAEEMGTPHDPIVPLMPDTDPYRRQ